MRPLLAFLLFFVSVNFLFAQNPEVDAWKKKHVAAPDDPNVHCSLCESFTRYIMVDSAKNCLAELNKKPLPPEVKLRAERSAAKLDEFLFDETGALDHYERIFDMIEDQQPPFELQRDLFLEGLGFASYFGKCNYGDSLTNIFITKCKNQSEDSLLMYAYLQKVKFLQCDDEKDSTLQDWRSKAEQIAIRNPNLYGRYYEVNALNAYYAERLPKCIEQILLAENAYTSRGMTKRLAEVHWTCASVYEEMGDFKRALEYLYKVKPFATQSINEDLPDFYNTMGWLYYRAGNIDSALIMIRRSVEHYRTYAPSNPDIAYPIGNLGLIFKAAGVTDSARYYSKEAVRLFDVLGYSVGVAEAMNNLGFIALERGQKDSAVNYLQEVLELLKSQPDKYEQMKANEGLYRAYEESDPKKAIKYYQRYSELKASVLSKEEALRALQLEAEYYQDRNEDHIQQLRYESQLKSLEIEQQENRILLTSLALIITAFVAGLIFFYWLQRKRMINTLREANEVNQRIISMISHDFRGPLNNVKMTLELLQSKDLEESEFLILSKDLYRQSSDLSLMFDSFVGWAISQRNGYIPARMNFRWSEVVKEVVNISKPLADLKNVRITTKGQGEIELETDRMACSLILRNLLSNAIKYSHRDSIIELDYRQVNEAVVTTVKDHGIGIPKEKLERILTKGDGSNLGTDNEYGAGLGLRMVIKYVQSIGGKLDAVSEEGKGTTFTISIPLRLHLNGSDQTEKVT